ncbi:response regulator transcription factor [Paenibacillus rigui]|uniref:DNA-binding response regulator n=1 Tax=Paenibacillus rigui TaxID=554312 RepID=A0A229UU69_9BACL|nr:response regulator [Paenibacillus rigui]OXM86920.1 DNA-binding response regulator [Paenibacillus rigui]
MYKVLLVDDERIILDGISNVVPWGDSGTELIGTARNGIEAFQKIEQDPPDIIISDIRMPGMDGLQLAAKVNEQFPRIRMILLSGFSEFQYAQSAMKYGVKHYLLKPCNESKISEALQELVEELKQSEETEDFISNMRYGLEKMMPQMKEQFLKEFVTNKTYGAHDWAYYANLFSIDLGSRKVRLLCFQLEGKFEFEHLFAVKNIAAELLERTVLSSTVGDHVLIVVEDVSEVNELHERIEQIRETFLHYYKIDLTIALSEADVITRARILYKQTMECLNYRFYLGEGSLITQRDIDLDQSVQQAKEWSYDEETLTLPIKTGRWEEVEAEIDAFFAKMSALRLDIQTSKSYVIQLFMAAIRLGEPERMNEYMQKLVKLVEMDTLAAIQGLFKEIAGGIARLNYEKNKNKHSAIVDKVIEIIEEQLGNPELSLNWVAHQMLYMNADYLGKLFKKETGEKFSNYVMKLRIKKATEVIEKNEDVKIFEIAEMLGFGDNPQYFSQVFKKYVGCRPSEYMKSPS